MKKLSLSEIKKTEFEILKHFRDFCKENNIKFFLSNGTLLGAIKYKGFIPWDDDIDVFVPRKDYDKLIDTFKDTEKYTLYSPERVSSFGYPFAKLCDTTTKKVENNISSDLHTGLDIDIFPLDAMGDLKNAKRKVKWVTFLRKLLAISKSPNNPYKNKSGLKAKAMSKLTTLIKTVGFKFWINRICSIAKDNQNRKSGFFGCAIWPIYGVKEIIDSKEFDSVIQVEFEGEKFPAPIGYDAYLRSLYGNYEKDPPLDKQQTHHIFTAYQM